MEGTSAEAAWAPRLGFGKSRFVYQDPYDSQYVLKLVHPDGHGLEGDIAAQLPGLFPATTTGFVPGHNGMWQCCHTVALLHWLGSVDHFPVHVLLAPPLDQYFADTELPMHVVCYIVALVAQPPKPVMLRTWVSTTLESSRGSLRQGLQ